ncbi:MAG: hypothetical protein ACFFCZ_05810 [Promethearchaeota archaeon]
MISEDIDISKISLKRSSTKVANYKTTYPSFLQKIGLILFRFEERGVMPYLETSLPTLNPVKASEVIKKAGVLYIAGLGQGDGYHQGLYGPVPVPGVPTLNAILYGFTKLDLSIQDPRAEHHTYLILAILFQKNDRSKILRAFGQINQHISFFLSQFPSVQAFPVDLLQELIKIVYNLAFAEKKENSAV